MLRIGTKLGIGIGVLIALCVVIGLVSYTQTQLVRRNVEEMTQVSEPVNSAVYALENNLFETAFATLGYLSTGDSALLTTLERTMEQSIAIQQKFSNVAARDGRTPHQETIERNFARLEEVAREQLRLRDLEIRAMDQLFKARDSTDELLTRRIQASVTVDDPVAYRRLQAVLEMKVNVNAISRSVANFLQTGDPEFERRIRSAEQDFKRYFEIYNVVLLSTQEQEWSRQLRGLSGNIIRNARTMVDIDKQRRARLAEFLSVERELGATLYAGVQLHTESNLVRAKQDLITAGERANRTIMLVLLFSICFGVVAGQVMTRNITRPIGELAAAMQAIANGDHVQPVVLRSSDELRSLGEAFNLMTGRLLRANEELRGEVDRRRRAQEALRASEQRFRLSIDGVKDYAIFMLDPEGRVASWNAGAERIKGYKADDIIGRDCAVFYPENAVQNGEPRELLKRALAEGRVETEGVRVRKDGTSFWANVVVTAVRNEAGTLLGFSKVTRDITERKAMLERLQESELRFRTMFEDAPIGIALADGNGRLLETNPAMQAMLGCRQPELDGTVFGELLGPGEDGSGRPPQSPSQQGRRTMTHAEVCIPRKNDRAIWVNLNVSPMHSTPDQAPYTIIMMEDITARRMADTQVRMLAHTITSMNEGVVITDSSNRILSVNPAFCRLYGYAAEEVVGNDAGLLKFRMPSGSAWLTANVTMREGGWTGEVTAARKNGEDFPVLLSTSVVRDDTGSPIAIVTISRDIGEQKRLQQQLREAERRQMLGLRRFAVSVQRAQEEERSRISRELHDDLCQRLSGMKFTAEVIADQIHPGKKVVVRRLRDFADELDRAISEVRRISSNLRPSVLDDFGLVIALKMLCKEFEALHGVRTTFELGDSTPRHLDPHVEIAIYRIAQEALSNIAKHAHASTATLHLLHHDASLRLIIEDDGGGFSEGQTIRARESGHGLGLISMRERTELLGGMFEVDSARDKGTTVSVTIPLGEHTDNEKDENSDR